MAALLALLRPRHWLKNLLIFFPAFMGGMLLERNLFRQGALPFLAFSLAASSVYIINDLFDARSDAVHPVKRERPIPSGLVSRRQAVLLSVGLTAASLLAAYLVDLAFLLILLGYLLITFLYTVRLKQTPIYDLFCISAGFLLRLQAGGIAFRVAISEWLFLSVFLLSLFLSTGKRLSEKKMLGDEASSHRGSLQHYPEGFLDSAMYMTGAAVMVTYAMYAVAHPALIYTVILCCFGLFRYIFLVKAGRAGDPTDSLLGDVQLAVVSLLWAMLVGWGIYGR